MLNRPLVYLTLAFIGGILLAGHLSLSVGTSVLICGLLLSAAAAGYFFHWLFNRWIILLLLAALGFSQATFAVTSLQSSGLQQYTGHYVTVQGMVSREADLRTDRVYYHLQVQRITLGEMSHPLQAVVLVRVPVGGPVYAYGDCLRLSGLLLQPQDAGNPGEFDYRAYLARQGVGAVLMLRDTSGIRKLGVGGNPALRAVLGLKEKLLNIARATLPAEQAALVNGIVFGTQGQIDRESWQIFSETGVVHILSVSGLHVGLVLGGMLALAGLMRLPMSVTAPAAAAALVCYAILSGLGPAVTRSTVMALMFLAASYLGRERDWPTTLAAAALVCLFWHPLSLYDIGFQLSFAATWGILYLGPELDRLLQRVMPVSAWLRGTLWVSLAAQLATLPLVAYYYNLISPVSLVANLAAVPLTGMILAAGAAASLTGLFFLPLAEIINASTSFILFLFMHIISLVHGLPGAVVYVPTPPAILIIAWYGLLYLTVRLSTTEERAVVLSFVYRHCRFVLAFLILGGVFLVALSIRSYGSGPLVVHFIDVGQGDSILVETPGGKHMLVDAGGWRGEFDTGEGAGKRVVVPYLRRLGVRHLDVLVLTHPHEDHAGGAAAVVKAFPVKLVVVSPLGMEKTAAAGTAPFLPVPDGNKTPAVPAPMLTLGNEPQTGSAGDLSPAYVRLLATLASRGVPVRSAAVGDRLHLDKTLQIDVLGPPRPLLRETRSDANNASVVLRMIYRQQTILLTGDIEVEAQRALLAGGGRLAAGVLKVPHHGSRYFLPEFLAAVNPVMTVISVGKRNNFGQPAYETIELLRRTPARTYRTDLDGAVILTTDGRTLHIKTGRERVFSSHAPDQLHPVVSQL